MRTLESIMASIHVESFPITSLYEGKIPVIGMSLLQRADNVEM